MRISIADYMKVNPKTNRGSQKRWTTYTAVNENDARRQHAEAVAAGKIPAGAREGGWTIER